MNIQIQQIDNDLFVDSRIIAKGFEIEHWNLCETLKKHFPRLERIKCRSTGGRPQEYHLLTKRDVMILPAVCKTTERTIDFQIKLIDKFLEMEQKILESKIAIPNNYLEAMKECVRLEETRLELEAKIEQDKPKVKLHDAIMDTNDTLSINEMAKLLGTGQKRLFSWLREQDYLMSNNLPYQPYLDRGYFVTKEIPLKKGYKSELYLQTRITPKGQVWLSNKYN